LGSQRANASINRKLNWIEIAQVMLHEREAVEDSVLERESVRLRKRYQSAKTKLQSMAVEAVWCKLLRTS
jgi:hypothetical protein